MLNPHALLVHGAGGGAWEWNRWRGLLHAQAVTTQAVDLQPVIAGLAETRLSDYRDQMLRVLVALPHPRVVIGASLGGLLALQIADHADAVIVVNPIPPAPWHQQLPQRNWEPIVAWHNAARLHATREAMSDADDASTLYAFRRWRNESGTVLREATAGVQVTQPRCPLLCIISKVDEVVSVSAIRAWVDEWQIECVDTLAPNHVGPLLGAQAIASARQAVEWLNRI